MESHVRASAAAFCLIIAWTGSASAQARATLNAEAAVMSVDRAFNQSVVDGDLARFLSFIAEDATFGGGTPNELHCKEAIGKGWGASGRYERSASYCAPAS